MKITLTQFSIFIVLILIGCGSSPDYDKVGYAPPEAFEKDSTLPDPTVTYQIYSIDDELIYTLEVKQSKMLNRQ